MERGWGLTTPTEEYTGMEKKIDRLKQNSWWDSQNERQDEQERLAVRGSLDGKDRNRWTEMERVTQIERASERRQCSCSANIGMQRQQFLCWSTSYWLTQIRRPRILLFSLYARSTSSTHLFLTWTTCCVQGMWIQCSHWGSDYTDTTMLQCTEYSSLIGFRERISTCF